jgi:SAM-dependent methyltransferase
MESPLVTMSFKRLSYWPVRALVDRASLIRLKRRYRKELGGDIVSKIHPKDEMYRLLRGINKSRSAAAATIEYLESGEVLLRNLEEIFRDIGYSFRLVDSFLDFACGYGRLARFLVRRLEPAKITVSDISEEGVDFTCRTLGVNGFYSTGQPERLAHDGHYDVIYVVSLFSHLPMSTWNDWLEKLYSMLSAKGLLIFSTHGIGAREILSARGWVPTDLKAEGDGFYYSPANETEGRLSPHIYGTTYVTDTYVREVIRSRALGHLVGWYPTKISGLQDAYVVAR